MAGVRHNPKSDIAVIAANLRDRYKSGFPILKELIQNADDALASELIIGWSDGLVGAEHPLLGDPAVFFINNESLTPEDVNGIMSIALGAKIENKAAVGKFGLGMKSLFHLGELFFFMANDWRDSPEKVEVFNPWAELRSEWEQFSDKDKYLLEKALKGLTSSLTGNSTFIVWVPLRSKSIMSGRGNSSAVIIDSLDYKQKVPDFLMDPSLSSRIANLFPMLKNLSVVKFSTIRSGKQSDYFTVAFQKDSGRICFQNEGCSQSRIEHGNGWDGRITIDQSGLGKAVVEYAASEIVLNKPPFTTLKLHPQWPSSYGLGPDEIERKIPDKAEPHAAAVFMRKASEKPVLTIQWAVFLPLGEQDTAQTAQKYQTPLNGNYSYDVLFHGYFFIDAGRVGIHGQRDIGTNDDRELDSEEQVTLEWNMQLANRGTLNCIIPAISALAEKYGLSKNEIESLCQGVMRFIHDRHGLPDLLPWITKSYQWVYRIKHTKRGWEKIDSELAVRYLPPPAGSPSSSDYERIWETFPSLQSWSSDVAFAEASYSNLVSKQRSEWTLRELEQVLDIDVKVVFSSRQCLGYMNTFLSTLFEGSDLRVQLQTLFIGLAHKSLISHRLSELSKIGRLFQEFAGFIYQSGRYTLPIDKDQQFIWKSLRTIECRLLLLPRFLDSDTVSACGKLTFDDAKKILEVLARIPNEYSDSIKSVEKVIFDVLHKLDEPVLNDIYKYCGQLPLFRARSVFSKVDKLVSRNELHELQQIRQLFIYSGAGNIGLGRPLQKALKDVEILFIGKEVSGQIFDHRIAKCEPESVLRLLVAKPKLNEAEKREDLLRKLSATDLVGIEQKEAMRYLLHAKREANADGKLWISSDETGVWSRLQAQAYDSGENAWQILPRQLSHHITQRHKLVLNIDEIRPEKLLEELGERLVKFDYSSIVTNQDEAEEVLTYVSQKDIWTKLPLHTTAKGDRVVLGELSVLDGRDKLPDELEQTVTRIAKARSKDVRHQQLEWIGKLDSTKAIRMALNQPEPSKYAQFIIDKLERLDVPLDESMYALLRNRAWLTASRVPVSACTVIDLPGNEVPEIQKLCLRDIGCYLVEQIDQIYQQHIDLLRPMLVSKEDTSQVIFSGAAEIPEYAIGECKELSEKALKQANQYRDVFSSMPGWQLALESFEALPFTSVESFGIDQLCKPCKAAKDLVLAHRLLSQSQPARAVGKIRACLLWAICALTDPTSYLKTLRLRANDNKYHSAKQLTYDVVGLDPKYLLHKQEWEILSAVLEEELQLIDELETEETSSLEAQLSTSKLLINYFKEWKHYIPEASIAPVLALMSGDKRIEQVADSLLGQHSVEGLLQNIETYWKVQVDYPSRPVFFAGMRLKDVISKMRFTIEIFEGKSYFVDSIFGEKFTAEISNKPDNIFIWEKTKHRHQYDVTMQIRPIELGNLSEGEIVDILKNSAELLLERVYHQSIVLDEIWGHFSEVEQLDVAVARAVIMESIAGHLRELKIKRDPIGQLLRDLRQDLVRKKESESNKQEFRSRREDILKKIRGQIETDEGLQDAMLNAMRRKVEDYQYRPASVPFELFQNADDALEERLEVECTQDNQAPVIRRIIVDSDSRNINFYHWGRDVNQYRTLEGGFDGRKRGFDSDLEKMLTLNLSDKGDETTGKFGLGFKSCLLVSDRPEIYSGRLAIRITAGIIPEISPDAERLSQDVKRHRIENRSPTLIHLPLIEAMDDNLILEEFRRAAGVLPIFAKQLKTIVLNDVEYTWTPEYCTQIKGLSFGFASLPLQDGKLRKQRVVHYQTPNGQFVFQVSGKGFISMADRNVHKFWVLNPLWETIPLGFIVEADFQVDIGRSQLARTSLSNVEIMKRLGADLAGLFDQIYQWSSRDWAGFAKEWQLDKSTVSEQFWRSTWRVLTDGWPQRLAGTEAKGETDVGAGLIYKLFMADNALFSFYQKTPVLPVSIGSVYPNLITLESVRYYADPLLSRLADALVGLPNFDELTKDKKLVSDNVGAFFRSIDQILELGLSEKTLDRIIETLVPNNQVSPPMAASLGKIFNIKFEKRLSDTKATQEQVQRFKRFLSSLEFLSEQQSWEDSDRLLAFNHGSDESLKAGFAPDLARLSAQYSDEGLAFFLFCRDRQGINVNDLFDWATWKDLSGNQAKQKALCHYLIHGELGEGLAHKLNNERHKFPWLIKLDAAVLQDWGWPKSDIDKLLNFMLATEQEKSNRVDQRLKNDWQSQRLASEVLVGIYDWWQEEKLVQLSIYQERIYPGGQFPWQTLHEGDIDNQETRKAWLQLLYLGSCQTIGRTREEQHRNALHFFEQKGWWEIFSAPVVPDQWFKVLDEYLDQALTNDQYRNWLQILPLYRFARGIEDYLALFYGSEQFLETLDDILRPGSSQQLAGTGISPPELKATLGIGINFIFRELVRNGAMESDVLSKHCYVPSRAVRELMSKLGCLVDVKTGSPADSECIYDFIADEIGDDMATFDNSFDIPLRIIYENQALRNKFFGVGQWEESL